MKENMLQIKILNILCSLNLLARPVGYRGRQGCPDVAVIGDPVVWLEIKSPKGTGRLRPAQKREIARMQEHGAHVYVIQSTEELYPILERHYPGAGRGD